MLVLDGVTGATSLLIPNALGKAIERHQDSLGIKGEAKRTHSYRATLLTELCRIAPTARSSRRVTRGHLDNDSGLRGEDP